MDPDRLRALRAICEAHPGPAALFLHVMVKGGEAVIRARGLTVDGSPTLVAEVESLLGPGAVTLDP